jgi:protein-L-isoaspartate(D-aspartate) O-methyltransferase
MVEELGRLGIQDQRVLQAFLEVPRHLFVDEALTGGAYRDGSLPIGQGQTISRPFTVARMVELLGLRREDKVLEVGTGSGYQSAILGRLAGTAYTIERLPALADRARANWKRAGISSVRMRVGDGSVGWPEAAPFTAIIVSAAAPEVPKSLLAQLEIGGRMVIPVGGAFRQTLRRLVRTGLGAQVEESGEVAFVRLIGSEGFSE